MSHRGMWFSTGRCLVAKENTYMVVLDDRSPYVMSSDKDNLFKGLESGDEILVLHGFFLESYPGKTSAYAVFKLSNGEITDISEDVLKQLRELGWIEEESDFEEQMNTEDSAVEISLIDPEGMTVETRIATPEGIPV